MNINRPLTLTLAVERWPIAGSFAISRGAKTEAVVVVATLSDGAVQGRGECVPYARYRESAGNVTAAIEAMRPRLAAGLTRAELQQAMPPGAARNALDCAFWDLEAKRQGRPVYDLAGLPAPRALVTALTISLDTPDAMAAAAAKSAGRALLKIKLGGGNGADPARITAVRSAAPPPERVVDAHEGWSEDSLPAHLAASAQAGVALIEQPLPDGCDAMLARIARPIPICADESAHDRATLAALAGKYDAVNVKLDKTGGLTEALAMAAEAERQGLAIMAGCMVGTSLSMAPAMLVAQKARYVDLDGPLLLAQDRPHGLAYRDSVVEPPTPALWG
jgi:L-alanine-DL-glutamate epimerase-like enolase superfamily enzyme